VQGGDQCFFLGNTVPKSIKHIVSRPTRVRAIPRAQAGVGAGVKRGRSARVAVRAGLAWLEGVASHAPASPAPARPGPRARLVGHVQVSGVGGHDVGDGRGHGRQAHLRPPTHRAEARPGTAGRHLGSAAGPAPKGRPPLSCQAATPIQKAIARLRSRVTHESSCRTSEWNAATICGSSVIFMVLPT
jgi:hypothetical protein